MSQYVVKLTKSSEGPGDSPKDKKRAKNQETCCNINTNKGRNQNSTIFDSGLTMNNVNKPGTIDSSDDQSNRNQTKDPKK